jgi:asparagine synthetase B (glutamine-hydrolysing)
MIGLSGILTLGQPLSDPTEARRRLRSRLPHDTQNVETIDDRHLSLDILNDGRTGTIHVAQGITTIVAGDIFADEVLNAETVSAARHLHDIYMGKGKERCALLNGSYAFVVHDSNTGEISFGTDQNSFIPVYYVAAKQIVHLHWDLEPLLDIVPGARRLNERNLMSWLLIGGRGFFDETRFEGVQRVEPGSVVTLAPDGIHVHRATPFHFGGDGASEDQLVEEAATAMANAIRRRTKGNRTTLIGLSGGLDSRIVLAAGIAAGVKNWMPYTYGGANFVETDIAGRIARHYDLPHIAVSIDKKSYLDFANDGVAYSGGASIFKHGIQPHLFNSLRAETGANGVMIGSALDLLVGGTHTPSEIFELNDRQDLFEFYSAAKQVGDVKNYLLFNLDQDRWCRLWHDKKRAQQLYDEAQDVLQTCLKNIPGEHPADINDALAFDIRIKRWYNHNLSYPLASNRVLTPTYDLDFLNVMSRVPYESRRGSRFRIKLLNHIDRTVSNIPHDATMQPAWLMPPHTKRFEQIQAEIDQEQQRIWYHSGGTVYLPSNRFDANFLEWFRVDGQYREFLVETIASDRSILCDLYFRKEEMQRLIDDHVEGRAAHHKLLQMFVSAELMCRLYLGDGKEGPSANFVDFSTYFDGP